MSQQMRQVQSVVSIQWKAGEHQTHQKQLSKEFPLAKPELLSTLKQGEEATASDLQASGVISPAINENMEEDNSPVQNASEKAKPALEAAQSPTGLSQSHMGQAKDDRKVPTPPSPSPTNPNTCSACGKTFSHRSALVKHQKIHTGEKPYDCKECGKSFVQRSDRTTHQRTYTGAQLYQCPECGKSFSVSSTLLAHQRTRAPSGEKPNRCGKNFSDPAALERHYKSHMREKPHKCVDCGKSFAWSSHLERHQRIHTGEKPYKCPECGRAFAWSSHLDRHMRTHATSALPEEAPPSKCADCGKRVNHITHPHRFKHQGTQMPLDHEDVEVTEEEEAEKQQLRLCMLCGRGFSQRSDLLEHQQAHTGEKATHCLEHGQHFSWCPALPTHQHSKGRPSCGPKWGCSSQTSASFAKHQLSHPSRPPHQCPDGGECCVQSSQGVHSGEKPPACGDSGRGLTVGSRLERPRHHHTRVPPYSCGECGKAFSLGATHQCSRDSESKPHRCPECGKGFSTTVVLERHRRLHRGEKPYRCSVCGKGFAWSSHFDRHRLSHTGEKPFPCTSCGKRFGRSSHHNRHQHAHATAKGKSQAQKSQEDTLFPPVAPWWEEGGAGERPLLGQHEVWPHSLDPSGAFPWAAKSSEDVWQPMGGSNVGQEAESSTESWTQSQVPPTSFS